MHARGYGPGAEVRVRPAKRLRRHPVYTGLTSNVRQRLAEHNAGHSRHTANGRPWKVIVVVAFLNERRAIEFEKYLKSVSGCAFAVRHFR
ncbi:MAG: GIY-YIG nuclease family protein [Chthoniobacterales bacterium]